MRPLRVGVLMHEDLVPPGTVEGLSDEQLTLAPWKTEYDVLVTLEEMGHRVEALGVGGDLGPVRELHERFRPHVVFNLLEEFRGSSVHVPYVLGYLELMKQPYTGCNPRGLILAHSKAVAKRILRSHRIRVPDFAVFERGRRVRRPKRLGFPLFVKSTTEHGSVGIAHSSVVRDDEQLGERVAFVHDQIRTDAIAEQYVEGREVYVGVLGNRRLQTFPVWELVFGNLPEGAPNIATAKVKWDAAYQKKRGVTTERAGDIGPDVERRIMRICRRTYRILGQSGYGRIDLRLAADGQIYVLECNPNPQLAYGEDFAESAESIGISYGRLLQRILNLGLRYSAQAED